MDWIAGRGVGFHGRRTPQRGGDLVSTISRDQTPLDEVRVADRENFEDGPPLELFRRLRSECPVHWTDGITEFPDEDGFWSVTTADDVYGSAATGRPTRQNAAGSRP